MPEVSSHPPGMLCWVELSTPDERAALRFYSGLFGWTDNPQPMGPGYFYHIQQVRGLDAAALYQQSQEEKQQGIPPHWTLYFATESADAAAQRATQAGGAVLAGPMDVFDAGRMAAIRDPQGAIFAVWQPGRHVGYRIVGEPGAIAWGELLTTSPQSAAEFYCTVLGVQASRMPGPMDYTLLKAGGKESAGIMAISPEMGPVPPSWMAYFTVADADASVARARSLGGSLLMGPRDIPSIGRFAVLQDPQGAVFCVFRSTMA